MMCGRQHLDQACVTPGCNYCWLLRHASQPVDAAIVCHSASVYLWGCTLIITITHIVIIFIPSFAAMPALIDVRQPHKGNVVLIGALCLGACHCVHAMWESAARAS